MDLFEKRLKNWGPLGQYSKEGHGYYMFAKLEGELSPRMNFRGREMLNWSLNNYLGLGNHPEIRKVDAEAAKEWGLAYPMGARMMSGQTKYHEELEQKLANFVGKNGGYLLNYGYQGMVSIIEACVDRNDVIVYDSDAHACIIDGMRLHLGKRFVYPHNDIEKLEKQLERATALTEKTKGGILVITEGVYGMVGDLGKLKEITDLKEKYNFRILVDDAHGIGTMGPTGAGTAEHFGVQDKIDLYFGTFAKSFASIGGFVAGNEAIVQYLMYNMRSQVYAKSLPMPLVMGALKRLEMIKTMPELRGNLWHIVNTLQGGLKERGFNLGATESPVTPVFFSGGLEEGVAVTQDLREKYNIFCNIITYPVIPKGLIMLRLIPTAVHSVEDVNYTLDSFSEISKKLKEGYYIGKGIKKATLA